MIGKAASTRRDKEAADWFVRLSKKQVSVAEIEAFQKWRSDPECREAYRRVEGVWMTSGRLSGDPEIQRALSAVPDRRARRSIPPGRPALAAALVGATAVVALGVYVFGSPVRHATEVGERRLVVLADGSRLQLDTNSRVDVAFARDRRELVLRRGQAMFDVAHDPDRPLVVIAGDASVRALGTRFSVRRSGDGARVTLVEGRVEVRESGASPRWTLKPGEQLSLNKAAAAALTPRAPRRVDVDAATSWTSGRLIFDRTPLATAVAEVNRYTDRPIVLDPAVPPSSPISGAFSTEDAPAFAEAVASIHGLRVTKAADGAVVLESSGR